MIRLAARPSLLLLLVIVPTGTIVALEPDEKAALTLREAVALALDRNQRVLMARAQREALKGRIREVRSEALPFLSFNSSGLRWRDPMFLNSSSFDKIPAE